MKSCKTAQVMNGKVKIGDDVIHVPFGFDSGRAWYGTVIEIFRVPGGCTWIVAETNIGIRKIPASMLNKRVYFEF